MFFTTSPSKSLCQRMLARPTFLSPCQLLLAAANLQRGRCHHAPPVLASAMSAPSSSAAAAPIDDGDWSVIGAHLEEFEAQREHIVKQSRDVQKQAKQAIFYLHQGALDKAALQLTEAEQAAKAIVPALQQFPAARQGAFSYAIEEFVSATLLKVFLEEGRLVRSSELPLSEPEEFLSGVLDFTDELLRHAIQCAAARDAGAVRRCRDIVDAIMGQFLQFDLRNSALRKKYDGLKYTLKKLENTLYELSLVEAAAAPPST